MSKGTLGIFGEFEYFHYDGEVFRASIHNPIGVNGYRQGARFECRLNHWNERNAMLHKAGIPWTATL